MEPGQPATLAFQPIDVTATLAPARPTLRSAPLHIGGLAMLAIAGAATVALGVEVVYGDDEWPALAGSAALLGVLGAACWHWSRLPDGGNTTRRAVQSVGVAWLVASLAGALPFWWSGMLRGDLALFEAVSGLTGTGSTVLFPIEGNTHGMLFYRQLIQWVGGMGIVVLAVAVLPFLGVGGLELFRAESPGPTSESLVPRVSETAKRLWTIYASLTAAAVLAYLLAGTNVYDAVSHAATGVGTGGFSPYNDSISHFDSVAVEVASMFAMLLGAVKFPLFYVAFRRRDLRVFWRSPEFRFFVGLLVSAIAFVTMVNSWDERSVVTALRESAFNVISLASSCGFGTSDFTQWLPAAQLVLLFLMVTGAMAGSTSGAVKLFRVQVMAKYAWREVRRARRPEGIFPLRLGEEPVPEDTVRSTVGYVLLYFVVAAVSVVAISMLGSDLPTAAGSVVTSMGGIGPGLGETGPASNFLALDGLQRAVLMFLMLLGRLEIFPLILFLVPSSRWAAQSRRRLGHRARPFSRRRRAE